MSEDITVHQDTTFNTSGRWSVVLGLGGMTALLGAGIMIGTVQTEVRGLREEVQTLRAEVQTRESKDAVALMFSEVRNRLLRIEGLLDRTTTPRTP